MRATHAALHFHQIYKSQAAPQADIMLLPLGTGGGELKHFVHVFRILSI